MEAQVDDPATLDAVPGQPLAGGDPNQVPLEGEVSSDPDALPASQDPVAPPLDWDSQDNPWRGRHDGLQGFAQQQKQRADQLQAEQQVMEDRLLVAEAGRRGLDENQLAQAQQMLAAERQQVGAAAENAATRSDLENLATQVGPMILDQRIQQEYGVSLERIVSELGQEEVSQMGPNDLIRWAKYFSKQGRANTLTERTANGIDNLGGGGGAVSRPMNAHDNIVAGLKDEMRRR